MTFGGRWGRTVLSLIIQRIERSGSQPLLCISIAWGWYDIQDQVLSAKLDFLNLILWVMGAGIRHKIYTSGNSNEGGL